MKPRPNRSAPLLPFPLMPRRATYRHYSRPFRQHGRLMLAAVVLMVLEVLWHTRQFEIARPAQPLDEPFYRGCQEPVRNTTARADAAIVMLARNNDLQGAAQAMRSFERQFNRHFQYPVIFLNDQPWSEAFKSSLRAEISGEVKFEVIEPHMWGFPDWIDREKAQKNMDKQERQGLSYAGKASYHHMCRFNSGFFFDHPALAPYRWYWRLEPDVSYTCEITYDPFVEMERAGKKYGYTIALWEQGKTAPSLFRQLADWKAAQGLPTSALWRAMQSASTMPWPFRRFLSGIRNRDAYGDLWNTCHFWSNFEIADLRFFRSHAYRELFSFLDDQGGFYYERWGDAPVHSLAAALLLNPREVHHFADIGYVHEPFQWCTFEATPAQKRQGVLYPDLSGHYLADVPNKEIGCRCDCDTRIKIITPQCLNRLRRTVM